jgi:hypothetical protein
VRLERSVMLCTPVGGKNVESFPPASLAFRLRGV